MKVNRINPMVNAAIRRSPSDFNTAFNSVMRSKLNTAIASVRRAVSAKMFSTPNKK